MKINSELLNETEEYVCKLIAEKSPENLIYHTLEHTKSVVRNAQLISKNENLTEEEMNILMISAWFHDIGYLKIYTGHEKESVKTATSFLSQKNVDSETIKLISESIMATKFPHKPTGKIAEILCDADFMHIGSENYFESAEKLRQELQNVTKKKLKKSAFEKESIKLFKKHIFFTSYCQGKITEQKKKNLKILKQKLIKREKKNKTSQKAKRYSRGVDSMFKLTARNQINLSSIADNKSNILISLNGIIISLGLAALATNFRDEPAIILPTAIFIVFSLSTIILAILSTRPHISKRKFSMSDIKEKKVNMLFFGNFHKMKLEEYDSTIKEMINDDQYLYSTMTQDQYFLGKVLAKKYILLRWAYNVFMVGLITSVIAFLVVFTQL